MHTHPLGLPPPLHVAGRQSARPRVAATNERASREGSAVHRRHRLHLWRLRASTEHGEPTAEGRKGLHAARRRRPKGVKSPRLPYSGPLVASRPRFNRRNGPNQRGGWIGHFLFSRRRHLWICMGSQHAGGHHVHAVCSAVHARAHLERNRPPCDADQ